MITIQRLLTAAFVFAALLLSAATVAARERPSVTGFSVSPSRFTVAQPGTRPAPASGRGTAIRFRLSKPAARLRVVIARRVAGRYKYVGVIRRRNVGKGDGRILFRGRLKGSGLRPGRYRAAIVVVDRRGRKSTRKTDTFRIRRPGGGGGGGGQVPGDFPNEATTGVPAGWVPRETRSSNMSINSPGVYEDVLLTSGANLNINVPNVTVRRFRLQGGSIRTSDPGVLIEDTTIDRTAPETNGGEGVISYCGYTARRVAILDRSEGFREGCEGPTRIEDTYIRIKPSQSCLDAGGGSWHGDGIQGYGGRDLHVTRVTIDFQSTDDCGGTAPFFYHGGDGGSPNGHAVVNGLLLKGGGFSFRMGTPGSVQGLKIVNNSWDFGPVSIVDAGCGAISPWEAKIVEVDANWNITREVRNQPCRG